MNCPKCNERTAEDVIGGQWCQNPFCRYVWHPAMDYHRNDDPGESIEVTLAEELWVNDVNELGRAVYGAADGRSFSVPGAMQVPPKRIFRQGTRIRVEVLG